MALLLLIDDDKEVLASNKRFLLDKGYQVYTFDVPSEGIRAAQKLKPDCFILDVMMPEMDGFEVCDALRKFTSAPIVFLSGKGDEEAKVKGLLKGADDYIVKPYSLLELDARIKVLLRRAQQLKGAVQQNKNVLVFKNLKIDKIAHKAFFKEEDLGLANKEYLVLSYLANRPNQEVTFEELGKELFGVYSEADRRSVMVNVSRLRKKLEFDPELHNMVETVWSKGYKFICKD